MAGKCKTINLANVSIETLKKKAASSVKTQTAVKISESCGIQKLGFIPPPPRKVRSPKIKVCRPEYGDYVPPPVPCICPPCPICPTPGQRIKSMAMCGTKIVIFYMLFEASRRNNVWGDAEGSSLAVAEVGNLFNGLFSHGNGHKSSHQPKRSGFIELDVVKYRIISWWDKAVSLIFTYTIGVPYEYIHNAKQSMDHALFGTVDHDED